MRDLLERLRHEPPEADTADEAADEIERLRGAMAAVRELTEHLTRLGFMRVEEPTQTIRRKLDAILLLADTDEGKVEQCHEPKGDAQ